MFSMDSVMGEETKVETKQLAATLSNKCDRANWEYLVASGITSP